LTLAGSFISRASILLIRVAILASVAMDDSKDRSPPFEVWTVNSLVFLRLAPIAGFSQLNPQTNPNPDFHPFARTLPDTWFLTGFSFDNPNYHRESGTDAISPHRVRALS